MSLYFDNDRLFDEDGHLTGAGLDALMQSALDEWGSLEAAEHLTFCDRCLLRYTALVESMPEGLQAPMRDLIPQVQSLMRLRSFRIMTNRYVSTAAAVVLAFSLWRFGAFSVPSVRFEPPRQTAEPRFSVSEAMGGLHEAIYGGLTGWMDTAQTNLNLLRDTLGGQTAEGEKQP
ncbi:MAG: hypothetical protein ACI4OI_00905 [Gemmiger sp.]